MLHACTFYCACCVLYAAHCELRGLRCVSCLRVMLHGAWCVLHCMSFLLHAACCMLRVARCIVHGTSHVAHIKRTTRLLQQVACHTMHRPCGAGAHTLYVCVARCTMQLMTRNTTPACCTHGTQLQTTGTAPVAARPLPHRHSRSLCACRSIAATAPTAHAHRLHQTTGAL